MPSKPKRAEEGVARLPVPPTRAARGRFPWRPSLARLGPHSRALVRETPIAFALKVLGAITALVFNLLLARQLGAAGVGLFLLGVTVVTVAGVVGRIGLDHALVRHVASLTTRQDWPGVVGVQRTGVARSAVAAGSIAVLVIVTAPWLAVIVFGEPELERHLRGMALAIVPFSLFVLFAQLLKGLGRVPPSLALQGIALPSLASIGVVLLAPALGVGGAVAAYVAACWLTLAIAVFAWRRATPQLRHVSGHFDGRELTRSSRPLFWSSLFNLVILWSPTLLLGVWSTSTDVGVFGVANRTAMLISFVLVAVNSVVAPKFAALHARGDASALGMTARGAARLAALAAAPMLLAILAFPGQVLSIFGPEFASGALMLQLLAVGQYVNVVTGSVGMLLMMCGHERTMRNITAGSAAAILVLNALLIPTLGSLGAAIAFAVVLILQNVAAAWVVWRRLGIRPLFAAGGR